MKGNLSEMKSIKPLLIKLYLKNNNFRIQMVLGSHKNATPHGAHSTCKHNKIK